MSPSRFCIADSNLSNPAQYPLLLLTKARPLKDSVKLFDVIEELVEERGLDRTTLAAIVTEGMLAAYERKYPDREFKADVEPKSGEIVVSIKKHVVPAVEDELREISLKKARAVNPEAQTGEDLWVPFDEKIGRIEILRARQVIAGKIRRVEADAVYNVFKSKEGQLVRGVVHKCEREGVSIMLDETLAFLPRSLSVPGEKCVVGYPVRALLKEVLLEPRNDNQLILDRSSGLFLEELFRAEIPEVFEGLVEVKGVARAAGYKAKVIVASNDSNIDPVGTCVGVGGSRIKPILKELGGEKIDIIPWTDSLETRVKNALKPAQIDRVEVINQETAKVWLADDQRSLAIGKMGKNIQLAAQLIGLDIQLVQRLGDQNSEVNADIFE